MSYLLLPVLLSYLTYFVPELFSYSLLIFIVLLIAILVLSRTRIAILLLALVLAFSLAKEGYEQSYCTYALDRSEIVAIRVSVISEVNGKENRKGVYKAKLRAVLDKHGCSFSASGVIYVYSALTDVHFSDEVLLSGIMKEKIFFSDSTLLIRRSIFSVIRSSILASLDSFYGYENEGILSSLLVTGRSRESSVLAFLASRSGLSYLFALSGMHIAIIASLISVISLKGRVGRVIALAAILIIAFLSGWRASIVRALIFRALIIFLDKEEAFFLSYVALLLIFPFFSTDLGAIYSFASLGGILLLSSRLAKSPLFGIIPCRGILAATLSALLFSLPLALSSFGSYSLASILFGPIATALTALYLILSLASLILPPLLELREILFISFLRVLKIASSLPTFNTLREYVIIAVVLALYLLLPLLIGLIVKLVAVVRVHLLKKVV